MYDRPETAAANDRLWDAIQTQLFDAPKTLTRGIDVWQQWLSPDLFFSQTCGYPYRARLHGRVQLIGTPVYDLPDCSPGHYYSALIVHRDDPREQIQEFASARFAYNEPLSQSGWAAPQNFARTHGFAFTNPVQTGAHIASAHYVSEGRADIAALDVVSWMHMQRHDTFSRNLKVIGHTPPTPALPFITALNQKAPAIFTAVDRAITNLTAADRTTLALKGITRLLQKDYLAVPNPPSPAT